VPAARAEIVVAMNDGRPRRVEQATGRHRVEDAAQQPRVPAIEQVAGDHEMVGRAGDDAIELALEGTHVGGVPDVRVREMRDEHLIYRRSARPAGSGRVSRTKEVSMFVPPAIQSRS